MKFGMSAGEDPWSGPGGLEAVATMLRNVVAEAAAGEDPWSGPGEKESGMGRRKAKRRRTISAKKEEKREMALWTCGVFSPDLKSAKSAWRGEVHIGRKRRRHFK